VIHENALPTWADKNNYVPPSGPTNAKIVLVGEAPGEQEVNKGAPFIGGSGQLLRQLMSQVGLVPAQCYMTNVIKHRPPKNDFSLLYTDLQRRMNPSDYLIQSQQQLIEEINRVSPNITVLLGAEALRAVTGYRQIGNWRGSILETKVGKCVPTFHPSYVLRMYDDYPILQLDLKRVRDESTNAGVNVPKPRFIVNPSFSDVITYLSRRPKRLAFDIETTGSLIRCLGLASSKDEAICIPFISNPARPRVGSGMMIFNTEANQPLSQNHWTPEQEYEIWRRIADLMSDERVQKVAQNAPFDMERLARQAGVFVKNLHMDTMIAWHTLYPELPKGLDFLCSILTRVPYYSGYDASDDYSTWVYNCWDCVVTYECSDVIEKDVNSLPLVTQSYYHFVKKPAVETFLFVEQEGILVNNELKTKRRLEVQEVALDLSNKIKGMSGGLVANPSSDTQIKKYLYQTLGLSVIYNRKTGSPTTDKHAREKLAKKYPEHKLLFDVLDEYSIIDTLLTGFLNKELNTDGRMRTHYNVGGTLTDRLSSSGEGVTQWIATNLQNAPRGKDKTQKYSYRFREMFIADPGEVLLKCDLSQAEFRLVVWLARIERLIKRYQVEPNFDVHKMVASMIFNKPESEIGNDSPERSLAKNGVYGGNYAMQYQTAAKTYRMPLETAKFILDSYRRIIPEIPIWWTTVDNKLRQNRTLINAMGRRRIFFGRLDDQDTFRAAYSDEAQSLVSGIINRAAVLANETFKRSECRLLLQVHDELVFGCKKELVNTYTPRIRNLMEYPLLFPGVVEPLVIPADISMGDNWHDQQKVILL